MDRMKCPNYTKSMPSSFSSSAATQTLTHLRDKNVLSRIFYYISFVMSRQNDPSPEYADVTRRVIRSEKVQRAIEKSAREELDQIREDYDASEDEESLPAIESKHRKRAYILLNDMKSCISSSLLRIAGWILFKILSKILTTIQFSKGQMETLKKMKKGAKNVPIIYLPTHRSHLDYILVSFILYMNDMKPPLVAAGDNLYIPLFGNLMRGLGAFFIKRKLDSKAGKKDHVYRSVLESYMAENMRAGESLEFFLEGGRSRSGKICLPKAGLLSVVVNCVLENQVEDVLIVPVGVSYDKLIDGNFAHEQLGKSKVQESFSLAAKAIWSTLHSNYGSVRVDFCQPFSLKEYLKGVSGSIYGNHDLTSSKLPTSDHNRNEMSDEICHSRKPCVACLSKAPGLRSVSSSASIYGLDVVVDAEKRRVIQDLSEHVIHDAGHSSAIMSTQMLAFILLNKYRKGATMRQLVPVMNWLREEAASKKMDVGFSGDTAEVIRYAVNLLGRDLVSTESMQLMAWSSSTSVSRESTVSRSTSYNSLESNKGTSRVKKISLLKPATKLPYVLELQYYSNCVASSFAMESIVANCICSHLQPGYDSLDDMDLEGTVIKRRQLVDDCIKLCNLLKYEFILTPPCISVESVIQDMIDAFLAKGILCSYDPEDGNGDEDYKYQRKKSNKRLAFEFELEEDENEGDGFQSNPTWDDLMVVNSDPSQAEVLDHLMFYRSILSPFIESYWITATILGQKLMGGSSNGSKTKEFNVFMNEMLESSKDFLRKGHIVHPEAIAIDTLKNSLVLFENWKVIERTSVSGLNLIHLTPEYDSREAMKGLILNIDSFRK